MRVLSKWVQVCLLGSGTLAASFHAGALPIGFGHHQGSVDYVETKNKHFIVYHDKETPGEGRAILNSLSAARPHLENWFGVSRDRVLPVVVSSVAAGASFANFITDAIELQTLGQESRDLYWHEYVHSTMYRHFDNWLGPAGAILHLPWMPTWFIEGLPESIALSAQSSEQAAYERYHALSGKWPSYERLHSLYGGQDFSAQGYATSGAFVAYIFRKYGADKLPAALDRFFYSSMPWWWPYALVPYGPFLPIDDALQFMTGKNGRELYEEYKKAASAHWKDSAEGAILSARPGRRERISPSTYVWNDATGLHFPQSDDGDVTIQDFTFDAETGWGRSKEGAKFPDEADRYTSARVGKDWIIQKDSVWDGSRSDGVDLVRLSESGKQEIITTVLGNIVSMHVGEKKIAFVKFNKEQTHLCVFERAKLSKGLPLAAKDLVCTHSYRQPVTLTVLGESFVTAADKSRVASTVYVATNEQRLTGDLHNIVAWNLDRNDISSIKHSIVGAPKALATIGDDLWVLFADRTHFVVRKLKPSGECIGETPYADLLVKLWATADGQLVLRTRAGQTDYLIAQKPSDVPSRPCENGSSHISPLLVAMRSKDKIDLSTAMKRADLWANHEYAVTSSVPTVAAAAPSDMKAVNTGDEATVPAEKRYRPVLGVPWIGADISGLTFGLNSIPLMDHMQNETLSINSQIGWGQNYPSTEISLLSTRYWPGLKFDVFRNEEWFGRSAADGSSVYVDEYGTRFNSSFYWARYDFAFELGMVNSTVRAYVGKPEHAGRLNEPSFGISKSKRWKGSTFSASLESKLAPASINESFEYNKVGLSLGFDRVIDFRSSKFSIDLQGARTRGPKRRGLQEYFQPIRTYVPGGGSAANPSFPVTSTSASLFEARLGDTSLRTLTELSIPVIASMEKMYRAIYFKSLNFDPFISYGGAWDAEEFGDFPTNDLLVLSVGANLNFLMDLNGVNFAVGLGGGKVLKRTAAEQQERSDEPEEWTGIVKFSFDSLLDVQ